MGAITYDRQTLNSPNPLARFAHRQRFARSLATVSRLAPQGGVVVDFGAGPGAFLSQLADLRPDLRPYAIEPYMAASSDKRLHYVRALRDLPVKADVITSLEVCEHLGDADLASFIGDAASALAPNGRVLITVPIMQGAALFLKELNRFRMYRRTEHSLRELLIATFGGTVSRPEDRRRTHKGFDFRALRTDLDKVFAVESATYSPLPLPWWANSQAFFVCRARRG